MRSLARAPSGSRWLPVPVFRLPQAAGPLRRCARTRRQSRRPRARRKSFSLERGGVRLLPPPDEKDQALVTSKQRALLAIVTAVAVILALAAPAAAKPVPRSARGVGEPEMVTLKTGRSRLRYGGSTRLYGRIRPRTQGETIEIVDVDRDTVVATDSTGSEGRFSVRYSPRKNTKLVARWTPLTSDPVKL